MAANNLEEILLTGVKFYASKSKQEAIALASLQESPEPGAICFVSDDTGNYIILDGKIFGDGTSGGGGGGGGAVSSVNGKIGAVVIELGDLRVTANKTLSDYFDDDALVAQNIKVLNNNNEDVIVLDLTGIKVNNKYVATLQYVQNVIEGNTALIEQSILTAESNAKSYADSLVVSVYKVKGSVANYNSLLLINNPTIGDVYNLTSTNMNYVYTESGWDPLGGTVDLSTVYTKLETDSLINNALQDAKDYADAKDLELSVTVQQYGTDITNLGNQVSNINNTLNTYNTRITNNTTNITNIATQLTWL